MAFRINVSGSYRQRGKNTVQLTRDFTIDTRITDRKQAYEHVILRLIEDNELGLTSGTYNFKNMIISIT